MTILKRIGRLFKADFHSILDSLEEPQALLKQAMREMQEEIERQLQELEQFEKRRECYSNHQQEIVKNISEAEAQVKLCLSSGNEKLGKTMVRKKLEAEKHLKVIAREQALLMAEEQKMRIEYEKNKVQLLAVQEKIEIVNETQGTQSIRTCEPESQVSEDEVDIAYLAAAQKFASSGN